MVIRYNDILSLITTLGDEQGLQVTIKESVKGGVIAGVGCAIGGTLFGPPGLAVGGAVGGCAAAYFAGGKFKPISSVILYDMSQENRDQLVQTVQGMVQNLDAADGIELIAMVQGSAVLKARIIGELTTFFASQMNMAVSNQ